jgi:hypothetical protein
MVLPMTMKLDEDYPFPATSEQLIDVLDQTYPHRCMGKDEDLIAHHRYSAVRELIDQLLVAKAEYYEEQLNDTTNESG